jgi:hypothetical protein
MDLADGVVLIVSPDGVPQVDRAPRCLRLAADARPFTGQSR